MKKLIHIAVDGLRPEMIDTGRCKFLKSLSEKALYTNQMRSVIPPITLPCFFSIFHGVNPLTHGVFYNIIPENYTVKSPNLFDVLTDNGINTISFFNWKTLGKSMGKKKPSGEKVFIDDLTIKGDVEIVDKVISLNEERKLPDFIFIYLGALDEVGHKYGWLSSEYVKTAEVVDSLIEKLFRVFSKECDFLIHSDHGGYEFGHYVIMEEIMNVPFIYYSSGEKLDTLQKLAPSIVDIAPIVLSRFGIEIPVSWEGNSIF
ncbi:alkaline phosphatase family protein [Desulfurobacterium atlanticum]|uniref:Type I phosphodiesterase / nucleotide pyrophosphatase n=1 Tax=Desulfurobacterium atlanticum TaxID=240169 RepID=A0A238Z810_9BACT|nr:alkaline phosphatase family protein [Desulfurobacterium atlanticum]SNR79635.1 Type I phosphodiesterase / nucleotide pyrophosphatase [Desulfurobacterium atlanticum]